MSHFPFFSNLDNSIIDIITNLTGSMDGAMPFVYFTEYNSNENGNTIGNKNEQLYTNNGQSDYRFPVHIVSLDVKPTGTMGVIREGSVVVKFASMRQIEAYKDFFRIGSAKSIVWGWNKNRTNGSNINDITPDADFATKFVGNIKYWKNYTKGTGHSVDVMVGPLINFSFIINTDASIDVTFTVGTPSEITAYLGPHEQDIKETKASSKENTKDSKLARLLGTKTTAEYNSIIPIIKKNTINYDTAVNGIGIATNIFQYTGAAYDSISEDIYISMEMIANYTINKNKIKGSSDLYRLNLDDAIGKAHKNIISNSENVIFLNDKMANPVVIGESLKLDITKTQKFILTGDTTRSFPNPSNKTYTYNGYSNTFKAYEFGYIKNIFLKADFVLDIIKNNGEGNIVNILEQICNEINIASCGLMELGPLPSSKENGNEIYTIVDYSLVPIENNRESIDLFGGHTTITNISFNCDLPKEIVSMAMLANRKNINISNELFFKYARDKKNILKIPKDYDYVLGAREDGTGGLETPTTEIGKAELDKLTKNGWHVQEGFGDKIKSNQEKEDAKAAAANPITAAINKFMENTFVNGVIDENCIIIKDADGHTPSEGKNGTKAILKDTGLIKNLYFGNNANNGTNPLLPIELEITILGLSGITIGQLVEIKDLPFTNKGVMQVTEVNHTVKDIWETNIKFKFRPDNNTPKK
jgi:hypothetical protein